MVLKFGFLSESARKVLLLVLFFSGEVFKNTNSEPPVPESLIPWVFFKWPSLDYVVGGSVKGAWHQNNLEKGDVNLDRLLQGE